MSIVQKLSSKLRQTVNSFEYFADKEVAQDRLNICLSCEHLYQPTRQCKKCFCLVDAKTKVRDQKCPVQKW